MHNFYYDETEHSRTINYTTITANNYYDNFTTVIVGWEAENENEIIEKYLAFEEKYESRKTKGELKSITMKKKDFTNGFASINRNTIEFYEDLLSLYDERVQIYICVSSKLEYLINQIFLEQDCTPLANVDFFRYTLIKAINVYRPQKLIEAIYKDVNIFVNELKSFLQNQIEIDETKKELKATEIQAYKQALFILDKAHNYKTIDWYYLASFDGFKKLLKEMNVNDYKLLIDREGDSSNTLYAAKSIGLKNVTEEDSKQYVGLRMADMLAGLISKMMKSLNASLTGNYQKGIVEKSLINLGWFELNERQLSLYKQLYTIICVNNNYWYKSYAGLYADDLIAFVSFLQYVNHFTNVEEIREKNNLAEQFNTFAIESLSEHFAKMSIKLPIQLIKDDDKDYFYNQKGAKVYKDINKQPKLPIHEGQNAYFVLSVGLSRTGVPLVTVEYNGEAVCYRLPNEYSNWAMMNVSMANNGINFFPEQVVFSSVDGKYYADIQ